jgi:aminoglycoside phosphotransferase (APT) family kinase protein
MNSDSNILESVPEDASNIDLAVDARLVTEWIGGLGVGARAPLRLTRIGDGKSNLTFLVEDADGLRWILRRPPLGHLLPSAHDVAREHRVLAALAATAVPVPRPIALRQADERSDVPLLLMEFVDGLVIDGDAVDGVAPRQRHAVGLELARALSRIHAVDIDAVGLTDLASHEPYAARQLRRWSRQFEDSKTRDLPLVGEIAARLERSIPRQHGISLVHGDYHLLNVIVDPAAATVRGVLDWELCTLGDPLADLGTMLAYWPQADDPTPPVPHATTAEPGFPPRQALVAAYSEASGRDCSDVGFWETMGCWKVAIICEGVLRRRLEEPENGSVDGRARLVEQMLERAADAADRASL